MPGQAGVLDGVHWRALGDTENCSTRAVVDLVRITLLKLLQATLACSPNLHVGNVTKGETPGWSNVTSTAVQQLSQELHDHHGDEAGSGEWGAN